MLLISTLLKYERGVMKQNAKRRMSPRQNSKASKDGGLARSSDEVLVMRMESRG
jgi:hypothetical protein